MSNEVEIVLTDIDNFIYVHKNDAQFHLLQTRREVSSTIHHFISEGFTVKDYDDTQDNIVIDDVKVDRSNILYHIKLTGGIHYNKLRQFIETITLFGNYYNKYVVVEVAHEIYIPMFVRSNCKVIPLSILRQKRKRYLIKDISAP